MVTLGRRPKPRLKPTNRIAVSRRTESSATRRGGSLRAPRGLLLRRCRDLRRCEGSAADVAANTAADLMHHKRPMIRRVTVRAQILLQRLNTVPAPCAPPRAVVP